MILRFLNDKTKWGNFAYLQQFKYAYFLRILFGFVGVWNLYHFRLDDNGEVPMEFILRLVVITIIYSFICSIQFTNTCSFFAEIADPLIGATYLTFLNTLSNLGRTWPRYLKRFDLFTVQDKYDGYYILVLLSSIYGVIWLYLVNSTLIKLDDLPKKTSWSVIRHKKQD